MGPGFEGHALLEPRFQNGGPHGAGPAVGGGPRLGKLDGTEKCQRWSASAEPGHKTGAFSVQNERC